MRLIEMLLGDKNMIDEQEMRLRPRKDGDKEPLFDGVKDLKGTLDKSNTLLEQVLSSGMVDKLNAFLEHLLPILVALNNGEKFIEIVLWKIPIKISLKDKVLKSNKLS